MTGDQTGAVDELNHFGPDLVKSMGCLGSTSNGGETYYKCRELKETTHKHIPAFRILSDAQVPPANFGAIRVSQIG